MVIKKVMQTKVLAHFRLKWTYSKQHYIYKNDVEGNAAGIYIIKHAVKLM